MRLPCLTGGRATDPCSANRQASESFASVKDRLGFVALGKRSVSIKEPGAKILKDSCQ